MSERLERAAERMRERIMMMPLEISTLQEFDTQRVCVRGIARFGQTQFGAWFPITRALADDLPDLNSFAETRVRQMLCNLIIRDIAFIKPAGHLPN